LVYNNVIRNSREGVHIDYSSNNKIYNNTVYSNSSTGIFIGSGSSNAVIKNNILYQNGASVSNTGVSTVLSSNLTVDPKFTNPGAADFSLQSGSSAIDAGVSLTEVPDDMGGVSRPKGSSADIGAYEYDSGGSSSSSPGVSVDSTYVGYCASCADDGVVNATGDKATTWASSDSSTSPHWVTVTFAAPTQINFAKIWWAFNNSQQKYMTSQRVEVQYWDGSNYTPAGVIQPSSPEVESSEVAFPSITTSGLRFYQSANQGPPSYPTVFWVTELEYGVAQTPSSQLPAPFNVTVK
jgi:parallel beta-helix repeat protein